MRTVQVVSVRNSVDPHIYEGMDIDTFEGVVFRFPGEYLRESLALGAEDLIEYISEEQVLAVIA